VSPAFDKLQGLLKQLPGLGYRSAERLALHLLVEKPTRLPELVSALSEAAEKLHRCPRCGNLCEDDLCAICADPRRDAGLVCVVEQVPDLLAVERSEAFRGIYHVLHGKLSPLRGIGPEDLNLVSFKKRVEQGSVNEVILALSNDIEGEATCHYLQDEVLAGHGIRLSRIGFGLPSGGGVTLADASTLKSALESRRDFH